MARRIDKLQINALNASNSQILVARGGELAYDDPANVFVGTAGDAGFANVALLANFANTAGVANVALLADTANVALEANIANLVLTLSNFTTDDLNEGSSNLYYTDARVDTYLSSSDISIGGNLSIVGTLDTPNFSVSDTLTVGSQIIYAQGTNGFSVNEDFDPSANALQTAYHFTSGAGRETVAFTLARTAQFTNGFGIRGTSADNKMVNFGEQNNTSFEWRKGVGIQPLNLGGGTLLANLSSVGNFYVIGNVTALGFYGESVSAATVTANSFASSGFGVPTIQSATNINLSANGTNGGAVVIQDSALRLRSFTEGAIANLTASAGDAVYNSSINKAQIYDGTNWANVGAGILDGDQEYSGNLIPKESNVYSLGSPEYRWKDLYLSGNTIFLGDVQLSSANSKLVVNSIEANIITTTNPTLYSAGRGITISQAGVIATSADDSEIYDVGIDQSSGYKLTDSMEIALDYPDSNPYPALLYSFLLTNATPDSPGFSNVKGVYKDPTGNAIYFADGLQTSFANTIELAEKPEIILPGTTISLQATANDTVYATFVYKTLDDLSYTQRSTNVFTSGPFTETFQTDNAAVIESIKVFNKLDASVPVTVAWMDENDSVKSYFVSNVSIGPKGFKQILTTPKLMGLGDKVKVANFSGQNDAVTAMVSARFGEVYNIVPSSNVINEGDEVTFAITTINVPSFATRYFRTSGNVTSSDFIPGNTGSFVIIDNAANVTLLVSSDQSEISEGEETFRLQVTRQSVTGPLLRTSPEVVRVKDTSNLINFSSSSTPASIYETEEAIITINTLNAVGSPGGTVYYTITGNADIYSNTSGAITINNNTANLSLIAEGSVPDNEERQFTVQIRRDSISGTIIGTTSNIIVKPIALELFGLSATGGDSVTEIEI